MAERSVACMTSGGVPTSSSKAQGPFPVRSKEMHRRDTEAKPQPQAQARKKATVVGVVRMTRYWLHSRTGEAVIR